MFFHLLKLGGFKNLCPHEGTISIKEFRQSPSEHPVTSGSLGQKISRQRRKGRKRQGTHDGQRRGSICADSSYSALSVPRVRTDFVPWDRTQGQDCCPIDPLLVSLSKKRDRGEPWRLLHDARVQHGGCSEAVPCRTRRPVPHPHRRQVTGCLPDHDQIESPHPAVPPLAASCV